VTTEGKNVGIGPVGPAGDIENAIRRIAARMKVAESASRGA